MDIIDNFCKDYDVYFAKVDIQGEVTNVRREFELDYTEERNKTILIFDIIVVEHYYVTGNEVQYRVFAEYFGNKYDFINGKADNIINVKGELRTQRFVDADGHYRYESSIVANEITKINL